ncbi:putative nucleotidyltransferase with HDIG domain [Allocatelliglobosispora scoriae]|uniref:Putative nucleotidyltransferase with HDIG domain n=1 Tax=Allocatelliglobosispora scoriae TaxID=643052 RepID=A0A841BPW5_9ACTN|nr:HD domain-containing protein [Allocatelliglobosispora scoriae]MBB5868792.1 putative nucleotidyltransferase with HDIG domain [Allocatelliglobosispora scoriae]
MAVINIDGQARVAQSLAQVLLAGVGTRWQHTQGVAARAEEIAEAVHPADREVLIAAAWLHDIGYSPALHESGFHPLDGAQYLAAHDWPLRLCALVAHHSGAIYVAEQVGLASELVEFAVEVSPVADALTYADQTTGPAGQPMSMADRMAEMLARHGDGSAQARAHQVRASYLTAAVERVEHRLVLR